MWRDFNGLILLHDVNKDDKQPSREQLPYLDFVYVVGVAELTDTIRKWKLIDAQIFDIDKNDFWPWVWDFFETIPMKASVSFLPFVCCQVCNTEHLLRVHSYLIKNNFPTYSNQLIICMKRDEFWMPTHRISHRW